MLGDALWGQICHAMGPDKGKDKPGQHDEKKPGVDQSYLSIGVAEAKPCIKIPHAVSLVIQNPKMDSRKPFSAFPATSVLVPNPSGFK